MSESEKPFLTARWEDLILANYSCDPALLTPFLPKYTELDLWQGDCLISLVGFRFLNTCVKGIKVPFHTDFEEVNLRFYVRHKHGSEWRRGVVFVREIVPKAAITLVANTLYKEHYMTCPMDHTIIHGTGNVSVEYRWKWKGHPYALSVQAEAHKNKMLPGTEPEFIAEHYWGYTRLSKEKSSQYEVRHPKWKIHPVKSFEASGDFAALYGAGFAEAFQASPTSVFLAEGSEVEVYPGAKLG